MTVEYQNESELMRTCGHLYVSIALESFATTIMTLTFAYLLLLITNKNRLRKPGQAAFVFVTTQASSFFRDLSGEVLQWKAMASLPLEKRFAVCRKMNQAVCMFQILIGILTVERWLHINNVNGFRYLGYAVTCPPMQTELIILIAPVVPCYKLQCYSTYVVTTLMLLLGYAASVMSGDVYTGSFAEFFETGDIGGSLRPTAKFWVTAASCLIQVYLTLLQMPYLWLIYRLKGGVQAGLPHGYQELLLIVALTWAAFPLWWCLSYEGLSIIKDTKMNAAGFAILNVIAKGSFTIQMLSMTKWHVRDRRRRECLESGIRKSRDVSCGIFNLETPTAEENGGIVMRRNSSTDAWLVQVLRPYDEPTQPTLPWLELEPTYRAFLVGQGITPGTYTILSAEQRAGFRDSFESTLNLVTGEDSGGPDGKAAQPEGAPAAIAGPRSAGAFAKPADPEGDMSHAAANADGASSTMKSSSGANIRVGQVVTTVDGLQGRVLKVTQQAVQVVAQGEKPQNVSLDDLTVLKILFRSVNGLEFVDSSGGMQLYCTVCVDQRPSSEVATSPLAAGGAASAKWHDVVDLHGFRPGSLLAFRLWCRDPGAGARPDQLLGEAGLAGERLLGGCFEGELQLSHGVEHTPVRLAVLVFGLNMPSMSQAHGNGSDRPVARHAAPPAYKDESGQVVFTF